MRCPFCGENRDKVIDSRPADDGAAIRRRRCCLVCNKRFTTYEHVEQTTRLMVKKRDSSRVPFERAKIVGALEKACYKRPISPETLVQVAEQVEEEITRVFDREVESVEIGLRVANRLREIDQIAYVRFAAVFKSFKTAEELLEELREVVARGEPLPRGQDLLF